MAVRFAKGGRGAQRLLANSPSGSFSTGRPLEADRLQAIKRDLDVITAGISTFQKSDLLKLKTKWNLTAPVRGASISNAAALEAIREELQQEHDKLEKFAGRQPAGIPKSILASAARPAAVTAVCAVAAASAWMYVRGATPIDVESLSTDPAVLHSKAGNEKEAGSTTGAAVGVSDASAGSAEERRGGSNGALVGDAEAISAASSVAAGARSGAAAPGGHRREARDTGPTAGAGGMSTPVEQASDSPWYTKHPAKVYIVGGTIAAGVLLALWLLSRRRDQGEPIVEAEAEVVARMLPSTGGAVEEAESEVVAGRWSSTGGASEEVSVQPPVTNEPSVAPRKSSEMVFENIPDWSQPIDMTASIRGIPGNVRSRVNQFNGP